jgi:hypothetical protein
MKTRLATASDTHLPYYSHSIMEAILTCPKWGLIRYRDRKYYKSQYRALALEAGSAMHEVFSALRLWQLNTLQNHEAHFRFHGERLYGLDRFQAAWRKKPNHRDEALSFCFEILNSGDYYDDPSDNVRTMANMEETTIRYVDEMLAMMPRNPIWVQDERDATALVGVEIPFDIVVDEKIRFIGTIDGVTFDGERTRLEENKTASRLDEAWREAFRVKFQPTGYTVAGRLLTSDETLEQTKVIGVKLKQSRSVEDFLSFVEHRDDESFKQWYQTLMFCHELAERYQNNSIDAPMFTHSCNRYFRPCGFIDLCCATREDQLMMWEGMETTPLSPSEAAILEKYS